MGLNWLRHISLHWSEIFTMDKDLNEMLETHAELVKVAGVKAKIYVDTTERPRFLKLGL